VRKVVCYVFDLFWVERKKEREVLTNKLIDVLNVSYLEKTQ
jgi:hypothetical protein